MAGLPWFELDVDMPDDPKCKALGVRLGNSLAFGYVIRLYAYCYRHGVDRFPAAAAPATIEDACHWRGKTGALFTAMIAEGFLDREGDLIVVHGVEERLEPTLAKMERDRVRHRERRQRVARKSRGHPEDDPRMSAGDKDKDKEDGSEITIGSDPPLTLTSAAATRACARGGSSRKAAHGE